MPVDEGITGLRDRSSARHQCPHATHADIVNKIVYLRQNYHFGPVRIETYLQRYHDITITGSAIYNTLVRLGLNRLPAFQRHRRREKRWKRSEKPLPHVASRPTRVSPTVPRHHLRSRRREATTPGRGRPGRRR